jgi:hypothetical protein
MMVTFTKLADSRKTVITQHFLSLQQNSANPVSEVSTTETLVFLIVGRIRQWLEYV